MQAFIEAQPISISIGLFLFCIVVILLAGIRITRVVDQLADRTGMGEALAGAVLLGASTSLSGSVLSITAAYNNHPQLSVSNALGGIAIQTFFLAIADISYRRANLEHASATSENLLQSGLLSALLALILLAPYLPNVTVFHVHPITPILFFSYIYGLYLIKHTRELPMWRPALTWETRLDIPKKKYQKLSLWSLFGHFGLLAFLLGISGYTLEKVAISIAEQKGLDETVIGVLLTATATSLPELVTSLAAVRQGALTLAVGGIIGGNAFDTLFTAASDLAYVQGSIYHVMSQTTRGWTTLTMLMSAILTMGLVARQKYNFFGVGFESFAIIVLYFTGIIFILF